MTATSLRHCFDPDPFAGIICDYLARVGWQPSPDADRQLRIAMLGTDIECVTPIEPTMPPRRSIRRTWATGETR